MFDELAGNEQQQEQEMGEEDDLMMVDEGRITKNEKCPYTLVPVSARGVSGWHCLGRFGQDFGEEGFGGRMLGGRSVCCRLVVCMHACVYTPHPSQQAAVSSAHSHQHNGTPGSAHPSPAAASTPCSLCCCCHPCRLRSSAIQWRTRWGSFTSEQPS